MIPDAAAAPAAAADAHLTFARRMDRIDGLAHLRERFVGIDPGAEPAVLAYLDGNSLGRPTKAAVARVTEFMTGGWGGRLIRGWDEGWSALPFTIGDQLGRAALGAAPGQVFVGDSTTVLLYKLARAATDAAAAAGRTEIVVDTDNFPTDRYVVEGIAAERGASIRWIVPDPAAGVTVEQVRQAVGPRTALVLLSHVAYRSGFLADLPAITAAAHDAGALVLWDLCHSAGTVPVDLDRSDVDLAVGCSYKYLNGGPGAPAFAYVRADLQSRLAQPIHGWAGAQEPFDMGPEYRPADGIRRFQSGTPPVVAMLAMQDTLAMIEEAGIEAVRAKSLALTDFAIALADEWLAPMGVVLASPRDRDRRGGHILLRHPAMRQVVTTLWQHDVLPDFRGPDALRVGLAPLSTSFAEAHTGLAAIRDVLRGILLARTGLLPG